MYIITCIILLNLINNVCSINNVYSINNVCSINNNNACSIKKHIINNNIELRNTIFRMVIFKDKTLPKIMTKIQYFYQLCCYKSVASVGEGMIDYYNLKEDDRTLIESVISLCY